MKTDFLRSMKYPQDTRTRAAIRYLPSRGLNLTKWDCLWLVLAVQHGGRQYIEKRNVVMYEKSAFPE